MCGLIGIVSRTPACDNLLKGLERMKYRGYDSAGVALLHEERIKCVREVGEVRHLAGKVSEESVRGHVGIGHTRWATHGKVSETNAHPHLWGSVAIVHNGIIENAAALKVWLEQKTGDIVPLESQTDSEIIAHLLDYFLQHKKSTADAWTETLSLLEGSYAVAAIISFEKNFLWAAKKASPLAIGYGNGMVAVASDAAAFPKDVRQLSYLEDEQWVRLGRDEMVVHDKSGKVIELPFMQRVEDALLGKGSFEHYMQKEIFQQPEVLRSILASIQDERKDFHWNSIRRLMMVGCGTAYHAARVAAYFFEEMADMVVQCEVASEYRYGFHQGGEDVLGLLISQSGETADTIAAHKKMKEENIEAWAIVNVAQSTLAREASHRLETHAGLEVGVASTKAFTAQLLVLLYLVLDAARAKHENYKPTWQQHWKELCNLPVLLDELLNSAKAEQDVARFIHDKPYVLYVGRGVHSVLAAEGALKLKEISYIHAEAYAAGELKHGPLALIEESVPVIVIAPSDRLFAKTLSNAEEIHARGGKIIMLTDEEGADRSRHLAEMTVTLPKVSSFVTPLVYALPIQRIAYETALLKGTDIDCPRNLAKSVTVE